MLGFISKLFGRRRSRFSALGHKTSALAHRVGGRRAGMGLGALATIAAPFIVNKIRNRRAQRAF